MAVADAQHVADHGVRRDGPRIRVARREPRARVSEIFEEEEPERGPEAAKHVVERLALLGPGLLPDAVEALAALRVREVAGKVPPVRAARAASIREVRPEGQRVPDPLQHAGLRRQRHDRVRPQPEAARPARRSLEQVVDRFEDLLHDRVLAHVVLALDELPVLDAGRVDALDDFRAVDARLRELQRRREAREFGRVRVV
mmetsp:Transcript_24504/g.75595  ORF Transcript_24504/g.75595 Transcript_24504/m.75595 type:complete len:200 (+) Transcript_24504:573-1172(+)